MPALFFLNETLKAGIATLEGSEYHHLARVRRHQVGDKIQVFDGTGVIADAEITLISRTAATLRVNEPVTAAVASEPELVVAVAFPKLQRAGWLVEKCVELGVTKFIPIATQHVVVNPRETKLDNLRELIIQACKQCGRAKLMEITEVTSWKSLVANSFGKQPTVVAHPGGPPFNEALIKSLVSGSAAVTDQRVLLVIGPEGGFSTEEVAQSIANGATLVSLGPRILRVETAVLTMAAIFLGANLAWNQ